MRILRVKHKRNIFYAALDGTQELRCLDKTLGLEDPISLNEVTVLPPVMPSKIICASLNYRAHAEELKMAIPSEPVFFFKPPSAVIGSGHTIMLPYQSERVDYEAELALVIGKHCKNITEMEVHSHIFGYTCANDVTARDLQKKDVLFARAKGFDTFAPIGPWIETDVEDIHNLTIMSKVNGEIRQNSSTADMIFTPERLVSFISSIMTLNPGDVVLTGTPPGIGQLHPGDEVWVEIPEVGLLINKVAMEDGEVSDAPIQ